MTRSTATRRTVRKTTAKTGLSPRTVLLAGLGAVSLGRKQAKARLAPVRKQAAQFALKAQAEFEARFAPVLAQFEGKAPAKRATRAAKRTTRPAAKRTRKRA